VVSDDVATTWNELFGLGGPQKIVCVGLNYAPHTSESGFEPPTAPLLFAKFANAVIGSHEAIVLPTGSTHVDAEAELAVVIGRRARNVDPADALEHAFGYTVANDVSARDFQFADGQWLRGKACDTFCPLLSEIVPVSALGDGSSLRVVQRLNGETLQDANTDDLIFDVPTLISYVSHALTLEPGDVILTGTPEGVGYFRTPRVALQPGDTVEIEIERIGLLTNPVVRAN
jgi:2-keto-4-pentenoate hydratase/2-oxohepta-3-ene-1,7-dioic acid hydratase in catechol pathway